MKNHRPSRFYNMVMVAQTSVGGSRAGGEPLSDSGYNFKVEPVSFIAQRSGYRE